MKHRVRFQQRMDGPVESAIAGTMRAVQLWEAGGSLSNVGRWCVLRDGLCKSTPQRFTSLRKARANAAWWHRRGCYAEVRRWRRGLDAPGIVESAGEIEAWIARVFMEQLVNASGRHRQEEYRAELSTRWTALRPEVRDLVTRRGLVPHLQMALSGQDPGLTEEEIYGKRLGFAGGRAVRRRGKRRRR